MRPAGDAQILQEPDELAGGVMETLGGGGNMSLVVGIAMTKTSNY